MGIGGLAALVSLGLIPYLRVFLLATRTWCGFRGYDPVPVQEMVDIAWRTGGLAS